MRNPSVPRAALLLCVLVFFSFISILGRAQTAGAGTITGTVSDPSHSVLPGSTVTVTNLDTNAIRTYTTNNDGI